MRKSPRSVFFSLKQTVRHPLPPALVLLLSSENDYYKNRLHCQWELQFILFVLSFFEDTSAELSLFLCSVLGLSSVLPLPVLFTWGALKASSRRALPGAVWIVLLLHLEETLISGAPCCAGVHQGQVSPLMLPHAVIPLCTVSCVVAAFPQCIL